MAALRLDSIGGNNTHPPVSCFQKARFPIVIAIGVIVALGGVFLTLAAYQVLPAGANAISRLGAAKTWFELIGSGLGISLMGILGQYLYHLYQSDQIHSRAYHNNKPKLLFEGIPLDENTELNFAEMMVDGKPQLVVVKHPQSGNKCEIDTHTLPCEALLKMAQDTSSRSVYHPHRHHGSPIKHLLNHPSNTLLDAQTFLNYVLEKEPSGTPRIITLNAASLVEIFEIAEEQNFQIDFHERDPVSRNTLFSKWAGKGNLSLTKTMLELDPSVIQQNIDREESFFAAAVNNGEQEEALLLLKAMDDASLDLSETDLWIKKAFLNDVSFQDEEFTNLDRSIQEKIYRVANIYGAKKVVLRLNKLGMQEELLPCRGPEIISANMDVISVRRTLKNFLINLRKNNLLFTKEEFDREDKSKYFHKTAQMGRILGRNYIEETIRRLNLQHMKVPKKIAVIDKKEDSETDSSVISITLSGSLEPLSSDLEIYAEYIEPVDRKLSREELLEFLTLIEATRFNDFAGPNFIIAADGVYAIDSEYRNFSDRPIYNNFLYEQLGCMVAKEDLDWLNAEVQKRVAKYISEKESLDRKNKEEAKIWAAKVRAFGFDSRYTPFNFKIDKIVATSNS